MWASFDNQITVRRKTALLVGPSAATPSMSPLLQPVRDSVLEVGVQGGSSNTGEVSIQGLVSGVTTTETLIFSGGGFKQTTRLFSSIVGLTTSGLANEGTIPTVQVRALGRDGSAQEQDYALKIGHPASIKSDSEAWRAHVGAGREIVGNGTILIPWDEVWEPRRGDIIDDEMGQRWEIVGHPRRASGRHSEFWDCRAQRHESGG